MNTICKMRDIYKALSIFETAFEEVYGISLNEAMVLCALREAGKEITSTAIAERTEMAPSHTSKVIRAVEDKGLIRRALGEVDKRQMYFSLTTSEVTTGYTDYHRSPIQTVIHLTFICTGLCNLW